MTTNWQVQFAKRTERMTSSAVREILKITQRPDVISFAGGLPAPEAFPIQALAYAASRLFEEQGAQALQYSTTEGHAPLRQYLVEKMARLGVTVDLDNVIMTTGSQQALELIGKVFLDPGDLVVCEAPSYLGALQVFSGYQVRFATVPIDDQGMQVAHVAEILKTHKAKFIYALPNFQNPGGTTLTLKRRAQLVALARKFNVPLIEDDPYGELRYEGEHLPSLARLDQQRALKRAAAADLERGNVIYTGTFSKTLAPGLRLGWIIAPHAVIRKLVQAKQSSDLHTSTFDQMLAYEIVKQPGLMDDHIAKICAMYKERRNAMLAALEQYAPAGVQWTRPQGGLFLWVTMPVGIDAQALLPRAVEQHVAFVPGGPFFASFDRMYRPSKRQGALPRGHNTMRLNFSNASPEQIDRGIHALCDVIAEAIASGKPG